MAENQQRRPFLLAGKKRKKVITIAVSLFVTAVFWIFNALNHDHTATIKYPVKIDYKRDDFILETSSDKYIAIVGKGYGWYLLYYSLGIGIEPLLIPTREITENEYITNNVLLEHARNKLRNIETYQVVSDTFRVAMVPIIGKKKSLNSRK